MLHEGQQLAVHFFHLWPVRTVHIRHIKIVALVAPSFIEDLLELFFRIEIHAQTGIQTTLSRLRRQSIGINDKERRNRWTSSGCNRATTSRAIEQLVPVSTNFVGNDTANKRRRFSITQPVANQFTAQS